MNQNLFVAVGHLPALIHPKYLKLLQYLNHELTYTDRRICRNIYGLCNSFYIWKTHLFDWQSFLQPQKVIDNTSIQSIFALLSLMFQPWLFGLVEAVLLEKGLLNFRIWCSWPKYDCPQFIHFWLMEQDLAF